MLKKFIKIFIIIIFAIFIFYIAIIPYSQEYINFHSKKIIFKETQNSLEKNLENFSNENIKKIDDLKIFYSLSDNPKIDKKIIEKIKNAKKNIFVEVYLFTHKNIRNAIISAHKRGVETKVILEKNIYKQKNLNLKTFFALKKAGIKVVWSNPKNYKLNHSKILIIDDLLILSSGNLTYSTFSKNTDLFIFTKNPNLVNKFKQIFSGDFIGKKVNIYDENIILSPNYTKQKFDKLFKNTKKSLKMFIPYLGNKFLQKILALKKQNIDIQIIFASRENNSKKIEILKKAGIKVFEKKNIHLKSFLIDDKILYIGSINFDSNSIQRNREMGLLIKNPQIIKQFLEFFEKQKN